MALFQYYLLCLTHIYNLFLTNFLVIYTHLFIYLFIYFFLLILLFSNGSFSTLFFVSSSYYLDKDSCIGYKRETKGQAEKVVLLKKIFFSLITSSNHKKYNGIIKEID